MKMAFRSGIALTGLLAACGPPQLYAIPDNPYSNSDSAVVHAGPLTLVASRNEWYQRALAEVSTPVELVIINRGKQTLPVALDELTLVDERGRVYRALPSQTVVMRLFGEAPPPPPPFLPPEQEPPAGEAPKGAPPTDLQSPPAEAPPSQTLAPTLAPGITLVAAHGGGGHGGGAYGGGGHFAGRGYYGGRGYAGWGGRFGYGYGYRGRFGPWGWGAPYWGYGAWGWWFGPAYVMGLDADPSYYSGYDPREFDQFGPWQVYEVAVQPTDLKPNERMGGLVFFEPAWDARVLTLHFSAHPKGEAPIQLSARFEVSR